MPVAPTAGAPSPYGYRSAVADPNTGLGVEFSAGAGASVTRDGTPSRVAGTLLVAGATLAVLKLLGFRFNVGVTS